MIEPPRKRGLEDVHEVDAGAQCGLHAALEVVHRGVRHDLQQRRHAHRARHGDATEVVALEIDDHHVLGAVLRIGEELLGRRRAGPRALERPGGDAALGEIDGELLTMAAVPVSRNAP